MKCTRHLLDDSYILEAREKAHDEWRRFLVENGAINNFSNKDFLKPRVAISLLSPREVDTPNLAGHVN